MRANQHPAEDERNIVLGHYVEPKSRAETAEAYRDAKTSTFMHRDREMARCAMPASQLSGALSGALKYVQHTTEGAAGGPARLQIVLLLGGVLGLDSADKAAISAVAGGLEKQFSIGHTEIGVLIGAVSFVSAVCTLPIGAMADRSNRRRILLAAIALWTVAMVISGTATSFTYLLVTRIFLGGVTAAAAPTIASLVGDFFPPQARARAYGMILAGELVGIGVGFILAGEVSALLNWRWGLYLMGLPSVAVGWMIWRYLVEPARGGQSWIQVGQEEPSPEGASKSDTDTKNESKTQTETGGRPRQLARRLGVQPRRGLVIHEDPLRWSLWRAVTYLIRIPTYRLLVIASTLAYYFFSGVRAFAMIYFTQHYHVVRSEMGLLAIVAGLGAIAGAIMGGRVSETLLGRGYIGARIWLPGVALLAACLLIAPALWTSNLIVGTALLTGGIGALAMANAPIDAARLDIVPSALWARGEGGRMALRGLCEGGAPVLFGAMSGWLGGGENGLEWTFLIMLVPVLVASALSIPAWRTYPRDVATAAASMQKYTASSRSKSGSNKQQ